jgi:Leucine-rich repeat (LRR) protein
MHGQRGELLRPFVAYLRAVYRGVAQVETLEAEVGQSCAELDKLYRESLDVTDENLVFVDPSLRNLCLGHTAITDAGVAHLRGMDQLQWLDLSFTATGDMAVARFAKSSQLRQLNLERTRITNGSLDVIKEFRRLEELDLSHTRIGDQALEKLPRLTRLKVLWLTGTLITDDGLAALSSLRNLEQLDVQGTRVSSEALERLRKQLPKLR